MCFRILCLGVAGINVRSMGRRRRRRRRDVCGAGRCSIAVKHANEGELLNFLLFVYEYQSTLFCFIGTGRKDINRTARLLFSEGRLYTDHHD